MVLRSNYIHLIIKSEHEKISDLRYFKKFTAKKSQKKSK